MKRLAPGADDSSNTIRFLTVDESIKERDSGCLIESRCWRYSLPFGAGAIWDCYRGIVLRGGAAGAGQRRPAGRDRQPRNAVAPRHATPLCTHAILDHTQHSFESRFNQKRLCWDWSERREMRGDAGRLALQATEHLGGVIDLQLAAGGLFCLQPTDAPLARDSMAKPTSETCDRCFSHSLV